MTPWLDSEKFYIKFIFTVSWTLGNKRDNFKGFLILWCKLFPGWKLLSLLNITFSFYYVKQKTKGDIIVFMDALKQEEIKTFTFT